MTADDEQAQLKALQTTFDRLADAQMRGRRRCDLPLLVVCFAPAQRPAGKQRRHATAAATLRQAVSVVLQRASDEQVLSAFHARPRRSCGGLCVLAQGGASQELNTPLPRAFSGQLAWTMHCARTPNFSTDAAAFKDIPGSRRVCTHHRASGQQWRVFLRTGLSR
jgi:hypothetical protein